MAPPKSLQPCRVFRLPLYLAGNSVIYNNVGYTNCVAENLLPGAVGIPAK